MKRETVLSVLKEIRELVKDPPYMNYVISRAATTTGTRHVVKDGMVTDAFTGLTWLEDVADFNGGKPLPWDEAMAKVKGLRVGGYNDWRLADNPVEHLSIFDYDKFQMFDVFKGARDMWYWTGRVFAPSTTGAMIVYFNVGLVSHGGKTTAYYVRPVRGKPWPW